METILFLWESKYLVEASDRIVVGTDSFSSNCQTNVKSFPATRPLFRSKFCSFSASIFFFACKLSSAKAIDSLDFGKRKARSFHFFSGGLDRKSKSIEFTATIAATFVDMHCSCQVLLVDQEGRFR